ncbi:hypothetical protein DPMN_054391 [Dreissena polymorpha]|uniref:Uncharacterized protein n=1 Tax=Dreissena polymorpha TaxID=45954 RepID=A0A9D4CQH3_DREPO|nr:hypothetical protein DPMN_054391 [Dreissena polymorpha]
MGMSPLEIGEQLVTLLNTSLRTMKAARGDVSSPLNHILDPSYVDVFPNPCHLISASPMVSQW